MVAIELGFAPAEVEEKIVAAEAGIGADLAAALVRLGTAIRRLDSPGLREVASTRVLIAAGRLVAEGISPAEAARAAVAGPLSDDPFVGAELEEMISAYLSDESA
jgi:nitric oxide reductase NorQ protein